MLEQSWNFIKKENPAQVFSCDFHRIFLEHLFYRTFPGHLLYHYYLNHQFFDFFFLLTYPIWIYWSFGSLCICFCFTNRVVTIIQIVLTLTKFVPYDCWLNKLPSSFFWNQWTDVRRRKNVKTLSECFTHGLEETIRVFSQVLSKLS